jgi:hypothetical protein
MYSTCLFCTKDLGTNEVLETLPIGRRLAFDPAQGRLWVICRSCARWNLVPFDTRLETIDRCEQLFRDTRTRYSTDNIGIARVREGLELVRIGPALRPEFAAWRYGDRFASRRRRNIVMGGTLGVVAIGAMIGLNALVGSTVMYYWGIQGVTGAWKKRRIATRFMLEAGGAPLTLSHHDVSESSIRRLDAGPGFAGPGFGVSIPARMGVTGRFCGGERVKERVLLTGRDAVTALGHLLPVVAGTAGTRKQVELAVVMVEQSRGLEEMLSSHNAVLTDYRFMPGKIAKFSAPSRLALEMLANEQAERVWLEGELKLLERQWRDAERLAAIADKLALPEEIDSELQTRKEGVTGRPN